jgi:asparagine synthase (glutamine-hydrolysing)
MLIDRQSLMYRWLQPEPVRRLLADHRAGRDDNHKLLFSLAMFEQWLRGAPTAAAESAVPAVSR